MPDSPFATEVPLGGASYRIIKTTLYVENQNARAVPGDQRQVEDLGAQPIHFNE